MHTTSPLELLIDRIIHHQLSKKPTFHPSLYKVFSAMELELIFNDSFCDKNYKKEVKNIKASIKKLNMTSAKEILKICKQMFPNYVTGLYDAQLRIEISTDIIKGEVLIEQFDDEFSKNTILTPCELIELYKNKSTVQ